MNTIEDFTAPKYSDSMFEKLQEQFNLEEPNLTLGDDHLVRRTHDGALVNDWIVANHRGFWKATHALHQIFIDQDPGVECPHIKLAPHEMVRSTAQSFTAKCGCGTVYTFKIADYENRGKVRWTLK